MRIQHNVTALNAYRNLRKNNSALSKNLEKLSSGFRINRAGDDAAGLAVSEKMRAQITGLQTAEKNAQDGISLVQTAEGALTEVHGMLNRMVELATQSANGTYDNEVDRANLQKEVASLKGEIDRIAEASNYNGIKLIDGSLSSGGIKTNIPNVTVNGLTGDEAATLGAQKVIEVTRAEDYKFSAAIDVHGAKKVVDKAGFDHDKTGQVARIQVKYNDEAGKEHIINMKLVSKANDGVLDVADGGASEVTLDGVKLKNSAVFAGMDAKDYSAKDDTDSTIAHAAQDVLGNIAEFKNLFSTKVTIADTDAEAAGEGGTNVKDGKYLKVEAKETGTKAEVTSFLINETLDATTDEAEFTIKDTAFSQVAAKIEDKVTVHGAELNAIAKGHIENGNLKSGVIEVDGQKFAFVNKTDKDDVSVKEALANFGIREDHIVYTSKAGLGTGLQPGMEEADAAAMKNLINTTLGKEVADVANGTDIVFKNKDMPGNGKGLVLQIGDTSDKFNKMTVFVDSMSTKGLAISDVDVSTQDKASESMSKIRNAINTVSYTRGDLGALQNRLEHTIGNLGVMTENITDAESRIRDTDMAKEMMAYTKNNILVQASQAMLAQANQIPQGVLQLLG